MHCNALIYLTNINTVAILLTAGGFVYKSEYCVYERNTLYNTMSRELQSNYHSWCSDCVRSNLALQFHDVLQKHSCIRLHSQKKQLTRLYIIISAFCWYSSEWADLKRAHTLWDILNQHGTTWAVTSKAQWADCFWECTEAKYMNSMSYNTIWHCQEAWRHLRCNFFKHQSLQK